MQAAEYNALSMAMKDLLPFRNIFQAVATGMGIDSNVATTFRTTVWEDNMGCLRLARQRPGQYTPRSKHYAVKYHWFRSHLSDAANRTTVEYIKTELQKADILTKGLTAETFRRQRLLLCGCPDFGDDEDAPIYNPKGVPLGWDGKPIPYWLFKLHGLNHFYSCEICGNETYRGRRNFEMHFADSKHAFGMKCLEIPNTQHFHGVTKIEDAKNLWEKLRSQLTQQEFDGNKEEEYEDSHGNVLSRATYEDLARQGML